MKKNVTIVIVTAAIIVLVSIFAVFLVTDKNKNNSKDANQSTQQMSNQKEVNSSRKIPEKELEDITVVNPKKKSFSKKNSSSKNDKNSSKKRSKASKDGKINGKGKKNQGSDSVDGLPIDWFDE